MRLGLVGAGWWAREVHAPAFQGASVRIQGVYAAGSPRARALAEAYGARVYEDYLDLLEDVDAVAIATPDACRLPSRGRGLPGPWSGLPQPGDELGARGGPPGGLHPGALRGGL